MESLTEGCSTTTALLHLALEVPPVRPPPPHTRLPSDGRGPPQIEMPATGDKPTTKFPNGAPMDNFVHPLSSPTHVLPDSQKGAPLTGPPQIEMLPFQSPPTIS
jgi:hypothetical protein